MTSKDHCGLVSAALVAVAGCFAIATAPGAGAVPGSYSINFRLREPGHVSVAVYSGQGQMLRELGRGLELQAGEHNLAWDGLDRYGQVALAGQYEWRLLRTPGFTREFLVNIGTNPGWTPFDLWPGNHAGPTTLMLDAETNLYIGSISAEGPPNLLKMSADGKQKFWSTWPSGLRDSVVGMARVGGVLYLLFFDGTVGIRRADTGQPFWGHPKLGMFAGANAPFADLAHPDDPKARGKSADRWFVSEMVLAGGRDFLVVTYPKQDDVRFFWPKDDGMVRTNSVRLPEPKGCCVAPDGRVFVVSGKSVVLITPQAYDTHDSATAERPAPISLIRDPELISPTRIAYDPANDDLLVVEHAKDRDHVRRYRAADGRKVAVYGRPAGRLYGVFNPLDWGELTDIAADGSGGFFTLEAFPRRVAHFRGRERHELVAQWFGGTQWGALCALDPADPTTVYLYPDHQHCARGIVDYAARAWTLTHLYDLPDGFSWALGSERHRAMFPAFGGQSYWEVRHVAGTTFLVNNGRLQGGCAAVVRVDDQEHRLVPVAFLGGLHPTVDRVEQPSWWVAAMKRASFDLNPKSYDHFSFSWSDTNQNDKIDVDEIRLGSGGSTLSQAHCFVDSNWTVYCALSHRFFPWANQAQGGATRETDLAVWLVVTNEGRADLPVWNWDHARRSRAVYPESEVRLGAAAPAGIFCEAEGGTYTVGNAGTEWNAADVPPITWPNSFTHASRVQKWNATGALEWSVGLHTAAKNRPPGMFAQVRGVLGEVRGCIVVLDACEPASVWTRDGLFAGSLYAERAGDGLPDVAYNQIYHDDNHWGLVTETATGDVVWGGMSHNSTPIYRVRGWENWERQSGRIVVTRPALAARWSGTGLHAEYFPGADLTGSPEITRDDPDIWFGPMRGDHQEVPARKSWPRAVESTSRRGAPESGSRAADDTRSRKFDGRPPLLEPNQSRPAPTATVQGASRPQSESAHERGSARWTGFFEPPLTEDYTFVIYTYGQARGKSVAGSRVRLWVDGQLILDEWDDVKFGPLDGWWWTRPCAGKSIPLAAGRLTPLRLEYAAAGGDKAHLHLFFGSNSIDLRHVPTTLLYPEKP